MKNKKAFTLIELLVVISIIALLLSILVPSLGMAKDKAKAVLCQTNLHSTGMILFLYATDHREKLSPDWASFDYIANRNLQAELSDVMWQYCSQDYWQDPKILFCPSAKKVATIDGDTPNPPDVFREWGHTKWAWYTPWAPPLKSTGKPCMSSYGINDFVSTPLRESSADQASANKQFWNGVNQKNASRIPMSFDSAWYSITPQDTSEPHPDPLNKYHYPYTFGPATLPRHSDKINMAFLDGSLRRVGIKELWALKWSKDFTSQKNRGGWPDWIEDLKE